MTDLGGPQTQYIPLEPHYIRSVNAAFDPAKSSSANLLAANPETSAAPGLGLMAAAKQEPMGYDDKLIEILRKYAASGGGEAQAAPVFPGASAPGVY